MTSAAPLRSGAAVVRCRGLTKHFRYHEQQPGLSGTARALLRRRTKTRVAVEDLDLDLAPGEVCGLLGRNGAGKTTTIKMLCGLVRPTAGELSVLGELPSRRSFTFLRQISVIFGQKSMLWWDLPAHDSLLLHRRMYDLGREEFDRTVGRLSELLELGGLLTIPVRRLSLGQRMRCELALALLHGPRLLFADEPTIGLDVLGKQVIRDLLARANAELGTSVVLTSHDMDDVAALCPRVVVIDRGVKRYDGDLTGLARSVRPAKQMVVTFGAEPRLPAPMPPGVAVVDRPSPGVLRLDIDRDRLPDVLTAVTGWGPVVDLEVADADLDEVMASVFGAARDLPAGEVRS